MNNGSFCLWTNNDLYKVIQNKVYDKSSLNKVSLKLYRNETEDAKILFTPDYDIQEIDVEVSALTNEKGTVLPQSAVSVGYVLYVPITKSSSGTKSQLGNYPDAILPLNVAKKYHINTVKAGFNQELYIHVQTDERTENGLYVGKIKVVADGKAAELPLEITVWDFALPKENHTKQYFILDAKQLEFVEGGGLDKYKRYYEDCLEYRINASTLPFTESKDYKTTTANYIQQLRNYYFDERISVISLLLYYNAEYNNLDYEKTEYVFEEIIKACVEDNVNYFKKLVAYIWILDEPHLSAIKVEYCKKVLPDFQKFREKIQKKCALQSKGNDLWQQLSDAIIALPNIITSAMYRAILPERTKDVAITWCPAFTSHHDVIMRWQALNKGEKWWYGCDWPVPPHPTYHIDDKLISSRLLSWMQYAYGITGNLYWRVNYWARKKDGKLEAVDPYAGSTYPTTNGEGMLIYPPKKFGLTSFIPTIRLAAIRDGIEDFEALYTLERKMQENAKLKGMPAMPLRELLSPVFTRLFDKAMVPESLEIPFEEAREIVANMLLAANETSFFVLAKTNNTITFFADCKEIIFKKRRIKNALGIYKVHSTKDTIKVILCGEKSRREVTYYMSDFARAEKYTFTDNWQKTVKKYQIRVNVKDLVKPYYKILQDEDIENYNPCCKDLESLSNFVWKTETVITKKKRGRKTEVKLYVPSGTFEANENYQIKKLDEHASCYIFKTKATRLWVQVKNEKGCYPINLYL